MKSTAVTGLRLLFLGQPRVEAGGGGIALRRRKTLALLAYLSVTARSHSRDELAELLYPDRERARSFGDLRQSICYLREGIGDRWVEAGPLAVGIRAGGNLSVDVIEFRELLKCGGYGPLSRAVDLYRGGFLSGFYLKDCAGFERWQSGLEESLRQECAGALSKLVELDRSRGDLDRAVARARLAVELDPFDEQGQRRLMRLLAEAGHRRPALRQYDRLRQILTRELGDEPEPETETLKEAIRTGAYSRTEAVRGIEHPGAGPGSAGRRQSMEMRFRSLVADIPAALLATVLAPAEDESRLVSLMFTEPAAVISSPGKSGPGNAVERMLLRDLVDIIVRYEGRLVRFNGDCAAVVFGAPCRHEDDPERAVLSAIEMRRRAGTRGVAVRTGIATGYARIAARAGGGGRTLSGPAARIAARMRARAAPGEIVIGEAAWLRTRSTFECTPLEPADRDRPRAAIGYRLDGRRPRPQKLGRFGAQVSTLVGRERELGQLRAAYARAAAGAGQIVTVAGEAGVGKSRLVAELNADCERGQDGSVAPLWLEGRCCELGAAVAYWPFIDMLGQYFCLPPAGEGGKRKRLAEALRKPGLVDGLPSGRIAEIGPVLARLFSVRLGRDNPLAYAQPEEIRHHTVLAIRDVILALARGHPLVMVLEDLHWADSLSIDLSAVLMESIVESPVLLLFVFRLDPEGPGRRIADAASRAAARGVTRITLRELTRAQSERMIDSLLPHESAHRESRERVLTCSQGNPFFMEEMLRSLVESDAVDPGGNPARSPAARDPPPVPLSLQSVILGRVDRLDAGLKRLLECAAVVGLSFGREELARADDGALASDGALADLERHSLIRRERARSPARYAFRHVLTQQAVYEGIPLDRRRLLHGRIAEAFESMHPDAVGEHLEQLLHHHESAGHVDRTVELLLRAGSQAREAYLNEVAVDRYERARALLGSGAPDRRMLQAAVELGKIYEVSGRQSLAEARLREGVEIARRLRLPPADIARVQFLLCKAVTARHRPSEYVPIAQDSLRLLRHQADSPEAVFAEFVIAYGAFEEGDYRPACDFAARRKALYRSLPYTPDLAINAGYLAWANSLVRNDVEAAGWLEWLEREAGRHNDLLGVATAHVRRGRDMWAPRGDLERAAGELNLAIDLYRRVGARYLEGRCFLSIGDIYCRFGRLREAEENLRRARSICDELNHHEHMRFEVGLLAAQIALGCGDAAGAVVAIDAAMHLGPRQSWALLARLLKGSALLQLGRLGEAAGVFSSLLKEPAGFRVPPAYSLSITAAHLVGLLERCGVPAGKIRDQAQEAPCRRTGTIQMPDSWVLRPGSPEPVRGAPVEVVAGLAGEGWRWEDPFGDCRYSSNPPCTIMAPLGRGLCGANLSAPRILHRASGVFTIDARSAPVAGGGLAAGGLVLWMGARDYLRLDRGSFGPHTVTFSGCVGNRELVAGRGRMVDAGIWLRLERAGPVVRALCSSDGNDWHQVGTSRFPADGPQYVGAFVDGLLLPEIHLQAYAGGAGVAFELVRLCHRPA